MTAEQFGAATVTVVIDGEEAFVASMPISLEVTSDWKRTVPEILLLASDAARQKADA